MKHLSCQSNILACKGGPRTNVVVRPGGQIWKGEGAQARKGCRVVKGGPNNKGIPRIKGRAPCKDQGRKGPGHAR